MQKMFIKSDVDNGVLTLTMHDPETRNAIGIEMMEELEYELDRLESDKDLRVLVLTGTDPSFCSGANVKRMREKRKDSTKLTLPKDRSPWDVLQEEWDIQAARGMRARDEIEGVRYFPLRLHNLQKPSIAAVNGSAIGLGMGIALSCDIRFASEKAKFSEMFVRRGLVPADGSCWQLPRMIGLSNTLMLQYTGDVVNATDAERLGFVNDVISHENLMEFSMEFAYRIAAGATYSMALIKKLVHQSMETDLADSLRLAGPAQDLARRSEDHKEGISSFLEKRPPLFKGR